MAYKSKKRKQDDYVLATVVSLIFLLIGIFSFISLFTQATGVVGEALKVALLGMFGAGGVVVPIVCIYMGSMIVLQREKLISKFWIGMVFALSVSVFTNILSFTADKNIDLKLLAEILLNDGLEFKSGGVLGGMIGVFLVHYCDVVGSSIIVFILMLGLFLWLAGITIASFKLPKNGKSQTAQAIQQKNKTFIAAQKNDKKLIKKDIKQLQNELKLIKNSNNSSESVIKEDKKRKNFKIPFITKEDEEHNNDTEKTTDVNESYIESFGKKPVQTPSQDLLQTDEQNKKDGIIQTNSEVDIKSINEQLAAVDAKKGIISDAESKKNSDDINKNTEKEKKHDNKPYVSPPINLLNFQPDVNSQNYQQELSQNAVKLVEALKSFSVDARIIDYSRGPTITRYELQPQAGVKISKITNLSDDIALHLAARGVRIEAPIPGKAAIGIEIPNKATSIVYLRELVGSSEFKAAQGKLSVALGKDISGQNIIVDLAKMPHLLIAGSTGSGKSVCINSLLCSLIYKSSPDEIKLMLIDPKVVELSSYNGIPHLFIPVVTDPKNAAGALAWAVGEMLKRYNLFAEKNVRDFIGYNKKLAPDEPKLPQIVIVIDELADLMMASPAEVEDSICRLAQMARAAGMCLVIATQRPSADVITGIIKANVPSRIAFAVSSGIDSRIILDQNGAEKLIGKGDMLYNPLGAIKPIRVQGCLVTDNEVEAVVNFVKEHYGEGHEYDKDIIKKIEENAAQFGTKGKGSSPMSSSDGENSGDDPKLMEAIEIAVDAGSISTSMLQRRLGLGYARAARLVDEMESRGIAGPYQGSKPRTVLLTKMQFLEMKSRDSI